MSIWVRNHSEYRYHATCFKPRGFNTGNWLHRWQKSPGTSQSCLATVGSRQDEGGSTTSRGQPGLWGKGWEWRLKLHHQGAGAAGRDATQTTGEGTPLRIPTSLLSSFQPVPPIGQKTQKQRTSEPGKIPPWDTAQGRKGQAMSLMTKRACLAQGLVPRSRWANSTNPSRHSWFLRYINYSGAQKQMKMFQINSTKYQDSDTKPRVAPKARKYLKANFIIEI